MKKSGKVAGIMLMIILATNISLTAQRGMRGFRTDSLRMRSDSGRKQMERRQFPGPGFYDMRRDFYSSGPMLHGRSIPGFARDFRGGRMMYDRSRGMHQDFRRMPPMAYGNMNRINSGQGKMLMQNIPGLTEKQKSEMKKLNEGQKEEMQKMMEEHREKIKKQREDNRKKMMEILNDDQKRWLEEHDPADRI